MIEGAQPVVVAFDGSPEAETAVRTAARLFGDRPLLIVSVWEPAFATAGLAYPDPVVSSYTPPSLEEMEAVDNIRTQHATSAAEAGARLAGELGATAAPLAVEDSRNVADALLGIADERDAAAVVVGSRGLGAAKRMLLGSTSKKLVHDARRPVLVVRSPDH